MREVKSKNKKRNFFRFLYSPKFISLVGVIILVVISIPLARSLMQKNMVEEEISKMKTEINNLESRNKELDGLMEYLQSDQFLERQARTNFGMKKRGEKVVVIKGKGKVAGVSTSSDTQSDESGNELKSSNFDKWASYFFER
jgi:cell division protein FtsB